MKKVILQQSDFATFSNFKEMVQFSYEKGNAIGFIPSADPKIKYMIVPSGSCRYGAVCSSGTWTSKEEQELAKGQYFLFDNGKELYKWMSE